MGASSSSKTGCWLKISLDLMQSQRISFSVKFTCLPGLAPLTESNCSIMLSTSMSFKSAILYILTSCCCNYWTLDIGCFETLILFANTENRLTDENWFSLERTIDRSYQEQVLLQIPSLCWSVVQSLRATLLKNALKEQRGGSWELFKKIKSTNGLPDTPATWFSMWLYVQSGQKRSFKGRFKTDFCTYVCYYLAEHVLLV